MNRTRWSLAGGSAILVVALLATLLWQPALLAQEPAAPLAGTPYYLPLIQNPPDPFSEPPANDPPEVPATPVEAPLAVADPIFADGFDNGSLSRWSGAVTDSGDLAAAAEARLTGTHGLRVQVDDGVLIYVTDETPRLERRLRARLHVDPNSIPMATGNTLVILAGYSQGNARLVQIELVRTAGGYALRAGLINDANAFTFTPATPISDAPHAAEIDWVASPNNSSSSGALTFWVDGVERGSITGIDNNWRSLERVRLGALMSVPAGARGVFFLDSYESRRTTYIGPGTPTSPTQPATPTATRVPPTNTPANTPIQTPTATPMANHMDMHWHAPGAHGDRPAHEHGDAPPQWVMDAGYTVTYNHNHGTPNENVAYYKHTSFKGWAGRFNNQDWYGVFHLDFNPSGHVSRFHSYQLWIRDTTGAVSHFSGWLDFGEDNSTGPNLIVSCGGDSNVRPIMMVNAPAPCTAYSFESWYARAGGSGEWAPDIGFNIATNYRAGGDPANPATWQSINGGVNNLTRRIEWAWYDFRSSRRGTFWADQWGRIVSGPNDPACTGTRTIGDRTYTIVCAQQVIQPTLQTVGFPGNAVQREFPGGNVVVLPN